MGTVDEFVSYPQECEYCNDDDRVLYYWNGDVWCARCLLENVEEKDLQEAVWGPLIWQTPDGLTRYGRPFHGLHPKL